MDVRVEVCSAEGSRYEPLVDFLKWLDEQVKSIPAEFLSAAKIEIGAVSQWGHYTARIEIEYFRPATPQEDHNRKLQDQRAAQERTTKELALLNQLKAKYE